MAICSHDPIRQELEFLKASLRQTAEGREGVAAFLAKRKPSWVRS